MNFKKSVLIIAGLALLAACVAVFKLRRERVVALSAAHPSEGPWFDILVDHPVFNSGRAPWEIPGVILGTRERGPWFSQASPGAKIGNVTAHRIELSAEGGWDLLIETDSAGRFTPATHVAFPTTIGGRPYQFNCRPADPAVGYLNTTTRPDSVEVDGSFVVEVMRCTNVKSGKIAQWPYEPLPVRGNFARLKKQG
jgi:hypothetical protein